MFTPKDCEWRPEPAARPEHAEARQRYNAEVRELLARHAEHRRALGPLLGQYVPEDAAAVSEHPVASVRLLERLDPEHPSLQKVAATHAAVKAIARDRPFSFGVWVREFHPGRVRVEWSAHIQGLGRRDAQTPVFLLEQLRELDEEEARTALGLAWEEP